MPRGGVGGWGQRHGKPHRTTLRHYCKLPRTPAPCLSSSLLPLGLSHRQDQNLDESGKRRVTKRKPRLLPHPAPPPPPNSRRACATNTTGPDEPRGWLHSSLNTYIFIFVRDDLRHLNSPKTMLPGGRGSTRMERCSSRHRTTTTTTTSTTTATQRKVLVTAEQTAALQGV